MTINDLLNMTPERRASQGMYEFRSLSLARSFASRATVPMFVMLSDADTYFAVTGRIAHILERAGFEFEK